MHSTNLSPAELILLSKLSGIGAKRLHQLVPMLNSLEDLENLSLHEWKQLRGVNPKRVLEDFRAKRNDDALTLQIERSIEFADAFVSFWDEGYPALLKTLYHPPPFLLCKGNLSLLESQCVGIVGSRKMTQYGKDVTSAIASAIAANGITVVSGFAQGVDTVAHREALLRDGRTIAVLGSGLNRIYPKTNAQLYSQFLESGGLIVSEFLIDTKPDAMNFPKRNRIIAGLSSALVVTEAHEKSGALITAEFALENNRDVYAVPGSILSDASSGCNNLIKQGATPFLNTDDFFVDLKLDKKPPPQEMAQLTLFQLNQTEEKILEKLDSRYHIDELAIKTNIAVHELSAHLLNLEINQLVKQERGQYYSRA